MTTIVLAAILSVTFGFAEVPAEESARYGVCAGQSVDRLPAGAEQARVLAAAGSMSDRVRDHVVSLLRARRQTLKDPGLDRFMVLGASASRNMYFLTGFGRGHGSLAPNWEFLRPAIDHFRGKGTRSSFVRKQATRSGTSPGSYVWESRICPDCSDRLDKEIAKHRPAFAIVMFGTNNAAWDSIRGSHRAYFRRVAAGYADEKCRKRSCLAPWQIGDNAMEDAEHVGQIPKDVEAHMAGKVRRFRRSYSKLIERLLRRQIVPLLTTAPPMPRWWLEENTVVILNDVVRELADKYRLPLIDYWQALHPTVVEAGVERLDWRHPVMTHNKGMGSDRFHPNHKQAFHIADENLIYGYNVRNTLTLVRLLELVEVVSDL